jgi:hypothetical protein
MRGLPISIHRRRTGALTLALAVAATGVASAAPNTGDVQGQLTRTQQRAQGVQSSIQRQNSRIEHLQRPIDDLTARLNALAETLAVERTQLTITQRELRAARVRLTHLQASLARDRTALAAQLVAQYESPQEGLVTVVLEAHGFDKLLERIDDMKRLRHQNVMVTTRVGTARAAVAAETQRLDTLERRRQAIANGTLVQRDEVERLRLAVVDRQLAIVHARSRSRGQLAALRQHQHALEGTLRHIQAQEQAASALPTSGALGGGPAPGVTNAPFVAHGGSAGFFPAPGTNYGVGVEPIIAARLDRLGKSLGLHLIGISGYRTPQHSVEVGGFADDPHTRGMASDTPGVEGVPEATLEQYGLTRPFGGAAEADHIQLAGSA